MRSSFRRLLATELSLSRRHPSGTETAFLPSNGGAGWIRTTNLQVMSLVSYHFSTSLYIPRIVYRLRLSRNLGNPASTRGLSVDQDLSTSPIYSYERLKVGKLHILRFFPPGHLFYLTKRCWLDFAHTQSLNCEFRPFHELRTTKSSFLLLKLRLSFSVSKTVKTTPPPQQFNLFLVR